MHGARSAMVLPWLWILLAVLSAAAELERVTEQSLRGDVVDHVVLLVPDRPPARFLGPDLHLRELRYSVDKAADPEAPVRGTLSFGRQSALQKKLRALFKQGQEFEMVVYFLVENKLQRLRFEQVKLVSGEKDRWEWTAAKVEIQTVEKPSAP